MHEMEGQYNLFARILNYECKMLMKSTTGVNVIRNFLFLQQRIELS
jgi:hypothetical protein